VSELVPTSRATSLLEQVLRVPPAPGPPAGAHESIRVFRGAPGLYRYQLLKWGLTQTAAAVGLFISYTIIDVIPDFPYKWLLDIVELFAIVAFLVALPFTYLMVHLDYQLRWYLVTDRSLRIREGLLNVSEKTMSFANIQNISVRQGPIQRLLGIADVEVRTAGGGGGSSQGHDGGGSNMHLGYFRGVDNAEEIRDAILTRVRQLRDSGLGDPDHVDDAQAAVAPAAVVEAARGLLYEVRLLRAESSR
jgi:uncharacterized membrane protein YdbT with pleckstrin-like domain